MILKRFLTIPELQDDSIFLWGARQTGKSTLLLFSATRHPNQDLAISTSSCWSLDIFSTVVRSCFVSGNV